MLRQAFHFLRLILLVLLAACTRLEPPGPDQPLIVGLPANPVFQQLSPPTEGMRGFSRDLVSLFAESLDVQVKFVTAPDQPALQKMLQSGQVHMAAAMPERQGDRSLLYTSTLKSTRQVIAQHVDSLPIDTPEKLAGREIVVRPGAPQVQTLNDLKLTPPPLINERSAVDELELLEGLARRRFELVATDDLHFAVAANVHPDLNIAYELPSKLNYAWAFDPDNTRLHAQAQHFIDGIITDGTLRRLDDRYFGHIRRLNTRDIQVFLEHVRTRLPEFRHAFHDAQEITGIDWRLIAALAYQESKWNPLATSFTGVRGMMMLTEDTADRMGVTNRLDANQSIRAGAKYLVILMDELPPEIKHPDRLWFALAAYNLGMGHLRGGRSFAPGLNRDPNSWMDMKQVLPLMSRPEYYERLKSGRARGGEAVILVENIRNYYDVLSRLEPNWTPPSMARETPAKKHSGKKSARGR
ncbi:MAG: membrane-bound lytic murein transglycosylase MltF [Rhodocyclaceae bacterium]|nr:membrane-bound lytic murein transglycosylase MltF [Rhodocyclaceae bacterium]MDZ4213899.1 membrane-bound lytic murein transglycosylase MltF [Rhodocyclaceae bacterium]